MAKRRSGGVNVPPLTSRQRIELSGGGLWQIRMMKAPIVDGWNEHSTFPTAEAKRAAWFAYRDEIIATYVDRWQRPRGWWYYEFRGWDGDEPADDHERTERLYEMGEVTEAGYAAYLEKQQWREDYFRRMRGEAA